MLVGRDALLAAGDAAVADAVQGHGRLLLLTGEAGIGKSTLAQAFADRARAEGAAVRLGACWEAEGLPPFTPWLDALRRPTDPACAALAERLGGGDAGDGDAAVTDAASAIRARARLFSDVADTLHEVSAEQPQLVVLEDLHWADAPSLELLVALAPRLRSMPVLVVGTYRDEEMPRPNPLAGLGGTAERMPVEGLDANAVAEIVAAVTGRLRDDGGAAELRARTGGNPLFVTEVARLLEAGSDALPAGVQDALERRLARMSSGCVEVLGAAAVLGHEFDRAQLAVLVDGDVVAALDEARGARLVGPCESDPTRWRFAHALVQATRYGSLSAAEREDLHRRAVDALQGQPGITAASLAHHAIRATFDRDDPTPAQLLVAAGDEALAGLAWDDAMAAFERALTVAPSGPTGDEVRAEAWLGIGAARVRLDRPDVGEAFDSAASLARSIGRPALLARAALGYSVGLGAFEVRLIDHRQIDLLEEAVDGLPAEDPLLPLVLARLSVALAFLGSDDRRAELAIRAVELARALEQPVVLGHALAARCDAFSGPEHVADRLAASQEITALGRRHRDLPLELLGRRLRVVALFENLRFAEVDLEIERYARASDALGDPLYAWYAPLWRAARALGKGELVDARRWADEAAAVGGQGGSQNSALLGMVFDFMVGIELRDRAIAHRAFDEMLGFIPDELVELFSQSGAYVHARLGDLERARDVMARMSADAYEEIPRDSEWVPVMCQMACAAALAGGDVRPAIARDALAPFAETGVVEGIGAYCHGSAHRYLAMVAAAAGDADAVERHVEGALRLATDGGALLEALTALDGAWALRRAGRPAHEARADELAGGALRVFTGLGLEALAAEAIALGGAGQSAPAAAPVSTLRPASSTLFRQGDTWAVTWEATTVHIKHAKGMADLAVLLQRPGRDVHVRELEGVAGAGAGTSAQPVLDDEAARQYRQRLVDLAEDLEEAERHADGERAARLARERDLLVDELTKAYGLGGQGRRLGSDPDERLRKAVSARVKASIDRLEGLHPTLGRHLRASVRTGFFCRYAPERPTEWTVGG
ncbi:MAG: AAA family ATPase [Acidimicrobiales bacterium]